MSKKITTSGGIPGEEKGTDNPLLIDLFPELNIHQIKAARIIANNGINIIGGKTYLLKATSSDINDVLVYTSKTIDTPVVTLKKWLKTKPFKDAVSYFKMKIWNKTEELIDRHIDNNNMNALLYKRDCIHPEIGNPQFALEKLKQEHRKEIIKLQKKLDKMEAEAAKTDLPSITINVGDTSTKAKIDKILELDKNEN